MRSATMRGLGALAAWGLLATAAAAQTLAESLASPYASERARAVEAVADLPSDEQRALLDHANPRVRAGAAAGLGARGGWEAAAILVGMLEREPDSEVRRAAALAIWRAVVDGPLDPGVLGECDALELDSEADTFVRRRLGMMSTSGTTWTDHAALSAFAPMGARGVHALRRVVGAEDVRLGERCLAALCLGRVDAAPFWTGGGGGPSPQLERLLLESQPSLQMALLYAASAFAPDTERFSAEIARFAREDAFGEDVIQAALYCLYTLPDADLASAAPVAVPCAEDFIDVFHSQLTIFNGAQLFRRLKAPELIGHVIEVLTEEPSFAGYWLFTGLLNNFEYLDEDDRKARTRALLEWGLSEANPVPQIRGSAAWYWRDRYGELPASIDLGGLLTAIRESVATIHPVSVDPDNYAQRSGADILALLRDPKGADVIRPLLSHHSEAVRMAAAMSAGEGKYEDLADALATLASKPPEYAAFGAAHGLMKLEDPRAVDAFCTLLGSGNEILARPSLANLRAITKRALTSGEPTKPSEWRALQSRCQSLFHHRDEPDTN